MEHLLYVYNIYYSAELNRLPRVKTCANLMKTVCYNNKDALMAGLICGGWDPYEGKNRIDKWSDGRTHRYVQIYGYEVMK